MDEKQTNDIQIELPDEIAQGVYANLAIIAHSSSEFVIDFISFLPGIPKSKVRSRIILTPEHTKRLMRALVNNIQKYESQYGKIKLPPNEFSAPLVGPIGQA